ncbi:MAG: Fe-Mn family superoxide dismutase [Thaumarchaeota archaeon]|nr:Fe-Mn family superoxide dismutase [Nitrososphaerota archaeon]MCL5317628.1 Fe-Mn family superoxide dismutase [Nitrososphaerota archaeon]
MSTQTRVVSYQARSFDYLLGAPGFSDEMLKNHFTLYQGYVKNTNSLSETLMNMVKAGNMGTPEFSELKRRFGWEWDGMRLHEYYFEGMSRSGAELEDDSSLGNKIAEDFGSYENWEKDFKATGKIRGVGWVALYFDPRTDRLINAWINEHDTGHLAGCNLLLIMDVFEHAFMHDYGLNRANYIDAFFKTIDWNVVLERFPRE